MSEEAGEYKVTTPATAGEIQRWEYYRDFSGNVVSGQGVRKSPIGQFVSYADHKAALTVEREKLDEAAKQSVALASHVILVEQLRKQLDAAVEAMKVLLDAVDYMHGNCKPNEQVGAVLDRTIINKAHAVLRKKP